ncbi:type II toxin-antitoxin system HicB family antitoxin [Aerococcus agrisoli]|uniref:type II toxin-antitoxin system HicB family antitoxin n=1 Tax=Aerococcus agrisoli TaxID=2487350 RepID=UPI003F718089
MMLIYPATFEKDGKYFLVSFPDIPEAMTQGETMEEAYDMALEVLELALEDKTELPKPSSVESVQTSFPDTTVALISIDLTANRRK